MISSGIIVNSETLKTKPDMVKRFLRATTRALEDAEKNPEAAVDAMLKANPKAGVRDTLIVGLKQTTALYHTKETANHATDARDRWPTSASRSISSLNTAGSIRRPRASPRTGLCSTTFRERRMSGSLA